MNNNSLKNQVTENIKWMGLGQVTGYVIQFVVWIILARLLHPGDFGALGITLAFSNIVFIFGELGIGSAIVQRKIIKEEDLGVSFWVSAGIGIVFFILAILLGPFISEFFQNPKIELLVFIYSLKILIDSFATIQSVLLIRELLFKRLNLIEVYSNILFGITAVIMAIKGFGIVSMAYGYLAKSILRIALLWHGSNFKPRMEFSKASFGGLFNFGKNIVGVRIINYIYSNIDITLIGKYLGSVSLGYYSIAMALAKVPAEKLSYIVIQVVFPAFCKLQDEVDEVKNAYNKLIQYTSIITFPLLIGLIFVSPQFIRVVYSVKWIEMVIPLQILCVYGIFTSVTVFVNIVFNSMGKPEYTFRFSLMTFAGVMIAVLFGLPFGLVGIATGLSICSITLNILGNLLIGGILKMKFSDYLQSLIPALISSGVMSMVLLVELLLQKYLFGFSDMVILLFMVISGALIYGAMVFLISRETFHEMKEITLKIFSLR